MSPLHFLLILTKVTKFDPLVNNQRRKFDCEVRKPETEPWR